MGAPILFILFCLIAAWFDLRYRRLPNVLNAAITIVGLAMAGRGGIPELASHALHCGLALMAGALLFYLGIVGGGDAKFYAGVAAWFGMGQAWLLALCIAASGGVMAFGWIVFRLWVAGPRLYRREEMMRRSLPYGVPIALGGLTVLWLQGSLLGSLYGV